MHDRCGVRLHVADRKHAVMQQLDLPGELGHLGGALGQLAGRLQACTACVHVCVYGLVGRIPIYTLLPQQATTPPSCLPPTAAPHPCTCASGASWGESEGLMGH